MKTLDQLERGDRVMRTLGGEVPMPMHVTEVTPVHIFCGPYKFSKATGGEIDEDLGWDGKLTGSTIQPDV